MSDHEISREEEIAQVSMQRPHVVLLGAGASRAAFPEGDRHGNLLPLMDDFLEIVSLDPILDDLGEDIRRGNFELLYSELAANPKLDSLRQELEQAVFHYFDSLELPPEPTLYDHLILSLRPKDVIATFNWDPFLVDAARRNSPLRGKGLPLLLFLHGNVRAGYCPTDDVHGPRGDRCPECGEMFQESALLYPVAKKDYRSDPMIRSNWEALESAFKGAFMVTIFGYSAPESDLDAIEILKDAWGGWREREMEQFEVIDIREEDELRDEWDDFIHTHHYEIHDDFYDSWIANHPRRTGEAYWNQYYEAKFIESNPLPRDAGFGELWKWFEPLLDAED